MEMVSIPMGQYEEFLSMRLELHLIYTKCRKEGALQRVLSLKT